MKEIKLYKIYRLIKKNKNIKNINKENGSVESFILKSGSKYFIGRKKKKKIYFLVILEDNKEQFTNSAASNIYKGYIDYEVYKLKVEVDYEKIWVRDILSTSKKKKIDKGKIHTNREMRKIEDYIF